MKPCAKHPDAVRSAKGRCHTCANEASRRWQKANPEKVKANHQKWAAANPEKRKANDAVQRAKPERKVAAAAWRAANPEKLRLLWRRKGYKKAGIDPVCAEAAMAAHSGCCDCCGSKTPKGNGWCVDHNHDTGQVRGILCNPCNLAIGLLNDNLDGVMNAVRYLEKGAVK